MQIRRLLALGLFLLLLACQAISLSQVTIVDGDKIQTVNTSERVPLVILTQTGFNVTPHDRVHANGIPVALDQTIPQAGPITLQLFHARTLTIVTPDGGQQTIQTAAPTVSEVLVEAGYQLSVMDLIDPPAETSTTNLLIVKFTPARDLIVNAGARTIQIKSSAATIGEALAEAGIPLLGLDYSLPSENEALPADGQIRVVRVAESIQLIQKPVPFKSETIDSPELELGEQQVLEPGEAGLSVSRVRIRYEDGAEVARTTEKETVVRSPKKRVVAMGTKIVLKDAAINGVPISYWRVLEMYATVYSPCNSDSGGCSYGTASGLKAGKGVVAVDPALYSVLQGQRLFIPGYGYAVIGDVGGGYIVEKNIGVSRYRWIDLGFDDKNIVDMTGWVTVYFLAPAPPTIPSILQ